MSYSRNQPVVKLLIFYWKPEIEKKEKRKKKKKKRGFKLESNEFKKVPLAASFCREKKRFKLKKPLLSYQSQAFTQSHRKAKSKPWLWSPKILKTQTLLLILSCPGSGTLSLSVWSIQTNTLLAFCCCCCVCLMVMIFGVVDPIPGRSRKHFKKRMVPG